MHGLNTIKKLNQQEQAQVTRALADQRNKLPNPILDQALQQFFASKAVAV